MPSLTCRDSKQPAVGQVLVLTDERALSRVELCPQRGAIVTSFRVQERELLYLDSESLADPEKNVRGGIPVLFPSPGRLQGDAYRHDGRSFSLKQHGFARNLPWTPSASEGSAAEVTLSLNDSPATLAVFPWRFALSLRFALSGSTLSLGLRVHNPGATPLPFAFGLHPYFAVSDKQHAGIDTDATRVFDNVSKAERPFTGFDLTVPELDLHLLDHGSSKSALHFADGSSIGVRASSEFSRWVVWTLSGKDFVCLEPWTAPFDALNSGLGLLYVAPGASHDSLVELELQT